MTTQSCWNELLDIELSLIGHCSEGCIKRFHDEPANHEALVSYVRGLMWKS
ncbi:hypothetical protein [Commensalibacter communis]|uniref:hypothetical protein n=1 Tax=Commensalibacter communis TaxID=2972786 RepID=UPI0022FF5C40|nr:hypothetical protein [Commensalibacter communis]CAI3946841.1 unnamed protein product [Commensalibacter communis]CAI3947044.1 unnamed protein product [Commensalibacter communis]